MSKIAHENLIFNINNGQLILAYLTKFTHPQSQTTPASINSYIKFEENWSKNTQDRERKRNGDGQTDRQTDRHSTQMFERRLNHNTPHFLSGRE